MKDSLDIIHNVARVVPQSSSDAIDFLTKIQCFYDSAWDKLIIVGGIIFGVFGIIIPIIFQREQKRLLSLQEKEVLLNIQQELQKIKGELRAEFEGEIQNQRKKFKKVIKSKASELQGMAHHLQGNAMLRDGQIQDATLEYFKAVYHYMIGKNYVNTRVACGNILNNCFSLITKKQLEDAFQKNGTTTEEYFEKIKKQKNYNHVFKDVDDVIYAANNLK
jgi:hypothetical protein